MAMHRGEFGFLPMHCATPNPSKTYKLKLQEHFCKNFAEKFLFHCPGLSLWSQQKKRESHFQMGQQWPPLWRSCCTFCISVHGCEWEPHVEHLLRFSMSWRQLHPGGRRQSAVFMKWGFLPRDPSGLQAAKNISLYENVRLCEATKCVILRSEVKISCEKENSHVISRNWTLTFLFSNMLKNVPGPWQAAAKTFFCVAEFFFPKDEFYWNVNHKAFNLNLSQNCGSTKLFEQLFSLQVHAETLPLYPLETSPHWTDALRVFFWKVEMISCTQSPWTEAAKCLHAVFGNLYFCRQGANYLESISAWKAVWRLNPPPFCFTSLVSRCHNENCRTDDFGEELGSIVALTISKALDSHLPLSQVSLQTVWFSMQMSLSKNKGEMLSLEKKHGGGNFSSSSPKMTSNEGSMQWVSCCSYHVLFWLQMWLNILELYFHNLLQQFDFVKKNQKFILKNKTKQNRKCLQFVRRCTLVFSCVQAESSRQTCMRRKEAKKYRRYHFAAKRQR